MTTNLTVPEQPSEKATIRGAEWFAAWLPKPVEPERTRFIEEIRGELKLVSSHLVDPSASGVQAALPHLERAISLFGKHIPSDLARGSGATLRPALEVLREELALANRLFENAYALQAGWASELGLNMDGTPKQMLYGRHGEPVAGAALPFAAETWEG